MKAKIIIKILTLLLLSNIICRAQNIKISGYVEDNTSKERLIGATIEYKNIVVTTNNFGFYSLKITNLDSTDLKISYLGYETMFIKNNINKDTFVVFQMIKSDYKINDIVINYKSISNTKPIKSFSLSSKVFTLMPMIGAEVDILKGLQMLPGISQSTEGKSDIIVRGGSSDQNMILLDDAPIYYLNHVGGFVSIFNINIIKNVELFNSSFPAKYGGRLSSIIDIRTIDGNMNTFKYNFTLSPISTNFFIEGPIIKNKLSFVVGYRRSFIDVFTKLYNIISQNDISSLFFYDFNGKICYKINEKNKLNFSFYKGNDIVKNIFNNKNNENLTKNKFNRTIGNTLASLKWTSKLKSNIFLNSTFTISDFKYITSNEYYNILKNDTTNYKYQFNSSIFDLALNNILTFYLSNNYNLDIGFSVINHNFNPANIYFFENTKDQIDTSILIKYKSFENTFFIENNFNFGNFAYFNIGIRIVNYNFEHKNHNFYNPRISVKFLFNNSFSLSTSYAKTEQSLHLINFSDLGGEGALWLPATNLAPPETSDIYTIGSEINISQKTSINIDVYYKTLENLIAFKFGTIQNNVLNWQENSVKNGKGKSYGIEVMLKGDYKKLNGWLAYTYSKTTRQFQEINNGNIYPYDFDRPHEIKLFLVLKCSKNIDFSLFWIFQSGKPISLPIAFYNSINNYSLIFNNTNEFNLYQTQYFEAKNSFRMEPYHRLDLALNINTIKQKSIRTLSFSIYNAYNHQNPYFYFFDTEYENGNIIKKLYKQTLFPFIPSVSYSIKF